MDKEELCFIWRTAIDHFSDSAIGRLLNLLRSLPVFFERKKVDVQGTFTEIIVNTCSKQFPPAPPTTKPSSFPLRRLSYVALQEILKHMDPIELIELSLCSRRCIQLVKIARRNKRLYLRLAANQYGFLMMYLENEYSKSCSLSVYKKSEHKIGTNLHDGMINGHKVKYRRDKERYLEIYWDDEMTGKVEIFKYITDLFHYPRIIEAHISEEIPIRPLYDWIALKYDGRIDEWYILRQDRSLDDEKYLGEICRKGKKVDYRASNRQHRFDLNFETDHLELSCVKWLNLDDMIKLSSQSVILQFDSTSLTSEDVNGFLKNWIKTTHSTKFRYIFMEGGNFYKYDIDFILSGIQHKPRGALPDHPFKNVDLCHSIRAKTGFTIQRNNGETASVFFSLQYSTSFEMILH